MNIKKIVALFLSLLLMGALLTACGGGSAADKAYDAWVSNHAKKMQEAGETFRQEFSNENDAETNLDIVSVYLDVLEPALEEFENIDASGLTGDRKDAYPDQLADAQDMVNEMLDIYDELYSEVEGE